MQPSFQRAFFGRIEIWRTAPGRIRTPKKPGMIASPYGPSGFERDFAESASVDVFFRETWGYVQTDQRGSKTGSGHERRLPVVVRIMALERELAALDGEIAR
jgi:hypothetical protein